MLKCDRDGVQDGVIGDPLACDFNPSVDLSDLMCPVIKPSDCFTTAQLQAINDLYNGPPTRQAGRSIPAKCSAPNCDERGTTSPGKKRLGPSKLMRSLAIPNYLFYEEDPGGAVLMFETSPIRRIPRA